MDTMKAYRAAESSACKAEVAALRERCKADVAAMRARHRVELLQLKQKLAAAIDARRTLAKRRVHDAAERRKAAARERARTRGGKQPDLFTVAKSRRAPRAPAVVLTPQVVVRAAKQAEVKPRWERAFIADVWRKLGKPGTLDVFKSQLWQWHKSGELRLTRADLVGALGEKRVAESEFGVHGATFHFVAWEK